MGGGRPSDKECSLPSKMDHFKKLSKLYLQEIIRLMGVSDWDPQFTSGFWKRLQKALGTQLRLSTSNYPQTDGQYERTIQILEDMLRACVMDFCGSWEDHLPRVEFAYNNSFQFSVRMA